MPLIDFSSEPLNESALKEERKLGDEMINKCIALILKAIPQNETLKSHYSTAVELTEENLLTHVCYEEYLATNIPVLKNIKWKYKEIHKKRLGSRFPNWNIKLRRNFYILEIKSNYWDELNSLNELRQQLKFLFNSKKTKGLLLIVNYKGGSYESADRIWCLINILKNKFPVYVYIKVAASSGYCIASSGQRVFISPCGYLGNVGTVLFSSNYDNILKRFGIDVINNISSPLKDENPEPDILKSRAQIAFTLFINRIAESRKLDIGTVTNLMDGSNFNSTQSVTSKFADSEETIISVLNLIKKENPIKFNFTIIKKQKNLVAQILNQFLPLSTIRLLLKIS